ncbi:phage tail protein [Yersinia enterocolitica]|uniref:phage tail protein n=1 Tax=Yersinia enterocolitica TaxID=630 RepID=UPI001C8ED672|nr:phage tail protein [Yersinia enterocolitica]MBX9486899.1 phage tail protein [Yersinia enterocolitica]MBX9490832.1 phage tail protein [Yersinia enterocolitica]
MADPSLNTPVTVTSTRIDATLLPSIFSLPYQLYVIQNSTDFGNVAGKANEAGAGAFDAQVRNDEQDIILNNHETRIAANTLAIDQLTIRVIDAEAEIVLIQNDVSSLTTRVTTIEGTVTTLGARVTTLEGDYVSKSATTSQIVQAGGGALIIGTVTTPTSDKLQVGGSANALVSYKVAGLQVIGSRATGWTASTGTGNAGAFNSDFIVTVGASYSQGEVQTIANSLVEARRRIKSLEDALRTHGLIN